MADKKKENLPKVPPFIIPGASNHYPEEPAEQTSHTVQVLKAHAKSDKYSAQLGMFSSLSLLIGIVSMGVALISGAWFAYGTLIKEDKSLVQPAPPQENPAGDSVENPTNVLPKVIVVALAYLTGWTFSAFGVRILGNLILPYAIQVYTWVVLGGILILQILIMSRLYQQEYQFTNYVKYLSLFGAGMIALIGLHLILEKHNLIPFGVLILLTSLGHLYSIVYHYIFVNSVNYEKLWGDIIFFFVTTLVSILMLAHFGLLSGMRRLIGHMFNPRTNRFLKPS